MKKIISILLAVLCACTLYSCASVNREEVFKDVEPAYGPSAEPEKQEPEAPNISLEEQSEVTFGEPSAPTEIIIAQKPKRVGVVLSMKECFIATDKDDAKYVVIRFRIANYTGTDVSAKSNSNFQIRVSQIDPETGSYYRLEQVNGGVSKELQNRYLNSMYQTIGPGKIVTAYRMFKTADPTRDVKIELYRGNTLYQKAQGHLIVVNEFKKNIYHHMTDANRAAVRVEKDREGKSIVYIPTTIHNEGHYNVTAKQTCKQRAYADGKELKVCPFDKQTVQNREKYPNRDNKMILYLETIVSYHAYYLPEGTAFVELHIEDTEYPNAAKDYEKTIKLSLIQNQTEEESK